MYPELKESAVTEKSSRLDEISHQIIINNNNLSFIDSELDKFIIRLKGDQPCGTGDSGKISNPNGLLDTIEYSLGCQRGYISSILSKIEQLNTIA